MGEELVTVTAGGEPLTGFESVTVEARFRHAAHEFHFEIAAEDGPLATAWRFAAGTPVDIAFNGDLACRGFVDRYQPKIAEHRAASIEVSGRSRSQDFIDSAAISDTGEFVNMTPAEIAKALDKFGVGVSTDQTLDKVPVYRITPGETAFRAAEKLCRAQGVWCSAQFDGSILITTAGAGRNGAIVEGVNLKEGAADHDWSNRHSHVHVHGQRPLGHGPANMQVDATSLDPNLNRYRPLVLANDDDTDHKRAQKRADHRRDSEAGNSLKARAVMQGFHDAGGLLWTPGFLAFVDSPFLGIAQDMAIDAVTFQQSRRGGSIATLSLVDPRALGAKSHRKGGRANSAWHNAAGD